jgi:hypothetical protein
MVTEDDVRRIAPPLPATTGKPSCGTPGFPPETAAPTATAAATAERDDAAVAADADTADGAGVETGADPEERATGRDHARGMGRAAVVAGVLPILVAGFRATARGWTPTGDDAYSAVRAHDVFSSNIPLLGTWSSASIFTGHQINHPGALHFDLLAVPVHLLGHGPGTAVGMALVNAAAVALVGWLVARRLGAPGAVLAMVATTLLTCSMGSEMLYDPWSQHAPLLPFTLFLVAVWCVAAGDPVALPIMVVAGSYALQTHLSYAILVPGLAVFALVGLAAMCRWQRRHDPSGPTPARGRTLRWLGVGAVTWLVVTAQPLVEQFTAGGEGNLTALARSRAAEAPTPSLGAGVRALGGTVVLPPAWLPPSYGSPSYHLDGSGRPTWLAAAGLAALALALAALGRRAWRRGSTTVAAGMATAGVALALGLVSIDQAPTRWGMAPTYLRWLWPLGMLVWLALAVAVRDEVRARRRGPATVGVGPPAAPADGSTTAGTGATGATRDRTTGRWGLALGLALTAVVAAATQPTVDHGAASPPWTVDAIHQIDEAVLAAVEDQPGVLVELSGTIAVGATGPAVFAVLQDAGVPFYVDDVPLVRQLGTDRVYQPGEATVRLSVRSGPADRARPGERLVAESVPRVAGSERDPLPADRIIKVYVSAVGDDSVASDRTGR